MRRQERPGPPRVVSCSQLMTGLFVVLAGATILSRYSDSEFSNPEDPLTANPTMQPFNSYSTPSIAPRPEFSISPHDVQETFIYNYSARPEFIDRTMLTSMDTIFDLERIKESVSDSALSPQVRVFADIFFKKYPEILVGNEKMILAIITIKLLV